MFARDLNLSGIKGNSVSKESDDDSDFNIFGNEKKEEVDLEFLFKQHALRE